MSPRKEVRLKKVTSAQDASKAEVVTAVLALLGGATAGVSVDELALACHRIDPRGFSWTEYSWLPHLDSVRVTLVDAGRAGTAETITNGRNQQKLWRLTESGQRWAAENSAFLEELRRRLPDAPTAAQLSDTDLVAIAVQRLHEGGNGLPVRRERVIAEAYRVFPRAFGLTGYPGWPDTAKIDDAIRRNDGLVLENTDEGTVVGMLPEYEAEAERLARTVSNEAGAFGTQRRKTIQGSAQKAVARVERSALYESFQQDGQTTQLDVGELCDLLSLTLEASPDMTHARVNTLKAFMEEAERWDLSRFVEWIGTQLAARNWRLLSPGEVQNAD